MTAHEFGRETALIPDCSVSIPRASSRTCWAVRLNRTSFMRGGTHTRQQALEHARSADSLSASYLARFRRLARGRGVSEAKGDRIGTRCGRRHERSRFRFISNADFAPAGLLNSIKLSASFERAAMVSKPSRSR
jgi:hypothetical protein